jgi:hypothetical protein
MAREGGLFAMHLPGHPEQTWSRLITMDHLGLDQLQRKSPQNQATMMVVTSEQLDLVDAWLQLCLDDNYRLVRDGPPGEVNASTFRDHRHDQSIFSGLVKRAGIPTLPDETFWAPEWAETGANYPLWAPRNRSRVSILDVRTRSRVIRVAEKAYSRVLVNLARSSQLSAGNRR